MTYLAGGKQYIVLATQRRQAGGVQLAASVTAILIAIGEIDAIEGDL